MYLNDILKLTFQKNHHLFFHLMNKILIFFIIKVNQITILLMNNVSDDERKMIEYLALLKGCFYEYLGQHSVDKYLLYRVSRLRGISTSWFCCFIWHRQIYWRLDRLTYSLYIFYVSRYLFWDSCGNLQRVKLQRYCSRLHKCSIHTS